MTDSLRDQLMGLGFKPAPKPERSNERKPDRKPDARRDARPGSGKPAHAGARPGGKPGDNRSPASRPGNAGNPGNRANANRPQGARKPRSQEEMDLAKAYAIRAQREKEERIEGERLKQEEARVRREAKAKLEELLKDKSLNAEEADIARHFPYGGKIKRIYVTADQLKALNAGELGVVQVAGRYILVTAELVLQTEAIFAQAVALKVDPNAPAEDDPYADPQYQVPDDLVW
ncbi:DUF2058 family protein [Stenotrophomonas sp. CFBP 13725]|uniref:DUF2058 domain-containing protein n=1 Tax=Stenotrophomonas sp. CFBP 13725 TaxID=2775297 RepID=UPI00177F3599|nr:DUF2058 family protein [Stenotrophomonas sp. CFBP 13725]MBD8634848.1 DUF2058 family protein [Stenotrophomonas sp. CFBP 13725]